MARRKDDPLCESVRDYCFDLLFPELAGEVPPELRRHAASCPICRRRLNDVKQLLGVLSGPQLHQHVFSRRLTQHFNLLNAKVRCSDIRQFLPFLADENLLMRLPTPVTVHSDQCPQCGHDVSTIASLMLKPEQLARLSGLYSHDYQPQPEDCPKFAESIKTLASLRLENIDSEAARHICACRRCRTALYEERLRLKLQNGSPEAWRIPCAAVKPVDMFDFLVPFGLDLHRRQYAKFTAVLADHLRQCPTCLERMRQLHNIIYTIDSRGDSGVTTIYQFAPAKRQRAMTNVSEKYPTWPIKVHAAGPGFEKKQKPPILPRLTQKLTQHAPKLKLKQLAKLTAAAAAFIVLATVVILNMPTSHAVELAEVYAACEKVPNIFISQFAAGDPLPIQKRWMSRSKNVQIVQDNKRVTLLDVTTGVRKTKILATNTLEIVALDPEIIARVRERLNKPLVILPFDRVNGLPPDAVWSSVEGSNPSALTETYELTWTGEGECYKWRSYINAQTRLPRKTEWYQKSVEEDSYDLKTISTFEYPDDQGMDEIIKKLLQTMNSG